MYKLLLAADKPEVLEVYAAINAWEGMGFRAPRIAESAQAAIESLKAHHADGVIIAMCEEETAKLTACLMDAYPNLPIVQAGRNSGEVELLLTELRQLLNRTHADFSNDDFTEADMLQVCRHEFFRALLEGRINTREDVLRRLQLLRSRMSADRPCVLVEMVMPEDGEFMHGRWHYGSDRLEVALRNLFGVELEGMRMLVSVLRDERVCLLCCPMLDEDALAGYSMTGAVSRHAEESIEHVREYLDLDLNITAIRVLPSLTALAGMK